ncbi:MAG: ectoine hydroxylase-related dioxygenase (phytanoyl-CoA dioxygenase family) [Candidatus Latescibacterota bacterium]|jgi:ectoine hydroxylase-related dioxygenase (phytanoyl-CoA dioxygenase family)
MDSKLIALGLKPQALSEKHIHQLDKQGYTVFQDIIDTQWLGALRETFDAIYETEGEKAGVEVAQMEGVRRLADLTNKGKVFDPVYLEPILLAAVHHVLQRPFKLHSVNGHDPLQGFGLQILHADTGEPTVPGGPYHTVNSMWMLDDFTETNGSTRIIPGSHLTPGRVVDYIEDRKADHPDQTFLTGKAGSVAVFNGSLWHSSYTNQDGQPRRTLHCAFIAREHKQQTDQRAYLRPETAKRLSPLARYVLDVD